MRRKFNEDVSKAYTFGKYDGLNFIDSTPLISCKYQRRSSHKVMKDYASIGKSSTCWFYGLKIHLIINGHGERPSCCVTYDNVIDTLTKDISEKLIGDKRYIFKKIFSKLYQNNITMITKVRNNIKNHLLNVEDKIFLKKRAVIESVNNILKNVCQKEHTRHRNPLNFLVNLISGLVVYSFTTNLPTVYY